MATTSNLMEQIWKSDIIRQAEDTLALWQTQYRFWERAKAQGAPKELLDALINTCEMYRGIHEQLKALSVCFPEAGR